MIARAKSYVPTGTAVKKPIYTLMLLNFPPREPIAYP